LDTSSPRVRVEIRDKKGVENVVANHLSRMNHGQDDKEPIEDKMRDDHLYRVLDKDTWMIDIIRAIRKMPLDHLDKNSHRRIVDVKCARNANHTASRTKLASHAQRESDVPVNFS
jgi:hypothetical protein